MTKAFTKDWVELIDAEIQTQLEGYSWEGEEPAHALNITYRIDFGDFDGGDDNDDGGGSGNDGGSSGNDGGGDDNYDGGSSGNDGGGDDNDDGGNDGEQFVYHLQCQPNKFRAIVGEPADPEISNAVFSQSYETAAGILKKELNTHIEFLMGRIHISGDVLALEAYNPLLKKIQECVAAVEISEL